MAVPEGRSLPRVGAGDRRVARWRHRARQSVNDLNGNTLSGGGRVNTWDSQNRLVQCVSGGNTSQFVYGADGLRRTSIVNGDPVHYVLDNGMMVREMVPSGQTLIPKATYLIGPRGPEYRRDDQTQTLRWYCYDGLGSVLAEVDSAGNLTASRKYDVYGLVRAGAGAGRLACARLTADGDGATTPSVRLSSACRRPRRA